MELTRLIELLAARQSPQARLESDQPLQIWTPEGWKGGNTPIPGQQMVRMISLVAPAHVRALMHDLNARYSFDFAHPNGTFRVDVEAVAGRRRVWVTRLDQNGQPLRPREESLHGLDFDEATPPTTQTVPIQAVATQVQGGFDSRANSGGDEAAWYYAHGGQSLGPHTFEQMRSLVTSGALLRETLVYHPGAGDWQQAKLSSLGSYFPHERAAEWVNPATQNWQPPSKADIVSEKIFVRGLAIGGVSLVLLLVGWVGLAQVRGSNRALNYSDQATVAADELSPRTSQGQLHNIHLTRNDNNPALYYGTAQYSNNYLADVEVEVQSRDFWSRPGVWQLTEAPHDFTGEMQSLVLARMNRQYAERGRDFRMTSATLTHLENNTYSGNCRWDDGTKGSVQTQITGFDADGQISTWSINVDAS